MPRLEFMATYRADLADPIIVGPAPSGVRTIHNVTGGTLEGPRLEGRLLPSGADWLVVGADGVGRLDVRACFETNDGARIYMQYYGVVVINDAVSSAMAGGGSTEYGDTYFMTQPRFETGDARYAWINSVVAVAQGRVRPHAVEYAVYHVVND